MITTARVTPTRLRLVIWHRTPTGELVKTTGNWNFREGLRHWMELYRASLLPGGTKEYVSQYLGYAPLPFEAMVLDGLRVVEQWSAEPLPVTANVIAIDSWQAAIREPRG